MQRKNVFSSYIVGTE